MFRFVLDSDGDPDTDAGDKGNRPASPTCLSLVPRHVADGGLPAIGIDALPQRHLPLPPNPEREAVHAQTARLKVLSA